MVMEHWREREEFRACGPQGQVTEPFSWMLTSFQWEDICQHKPLSLTFLHVASVLCDVSYAQSTQSNLLSHLYRSISIMLEIGPSIIFSITLVLRTLGFLV